MTRGKRQRTRAKEADRTFDDVRALVQDELNESVTLAAEQCLWVVDLTETWVVYEVDGSGGGVGTFQCDYSIDDGGEATLGEPKAVQRVTTYQPATETESVQIQQGGGRILESKGTDESGGRIFRVEILQFGQSRNGRVYPADVMTRAVEAYEGAKAYDHHRSLDELRSSTIGGLAGYYADVTATGHALEADLHLLPGATHAAEAFDASLAHQAQGGKPLIGISHDVVAQTRKIEVAGRRLEEATQIVSVNSADIVADPSAGGRAIRMVAGGSGADLQEETDMPTIESIKDALEGASPEDRAALAELLGLAPSEKPAAAVADDDADKDVEKEKELVSVGAATESMKFDRNGVLGKQLVRAAVADAKLDERLTESVLRELPERFTEAEATRSVAMVSKLARAIEADELAPTVQHQTAKVTREQRDKVLARVDATFGIRQLESGETELIGDTPRGAYHSIRQMWEDVTGYRPSYDDDIPRIIMRECFDAIPAEGTRVTESVDTTTFGHIMGDSITRRLIAEYNIPNLQDWRDIVSSIVPRSDFRTVRLERMGGYGTLPAVAQGAPYQPLTTPSDEEVTYAIAKKGGTEDLTIETIANDDLGALTRIPKLLGRAAAITLRNYVWAFLSSNATIYDSTALFTVGHANLGTSALSNATLTAARAAMRAQTAYGDTSAILDIVPKFLVVPPALEEVATQLTNSAYAIGANAGTATGANITNIPNLHAGMTAKVVSYLSDTNDWFVVADPSMIPTIELGFYQGRQEPELFVQDDPKVGAVFNADKITYKVRHIYAGAVLDYRAFYQGHL